jgi:hypothetical protein
MAVYPLPEVANQLSRFTGPPASFAEAVGIPGASADDIINPDFPYKLEYMDVTQILQFGVPNLEKRIATAHTLPRKITLSYTALENAGLAMLRQFYLDRKGSWESFQFLELDEATFDNPATADIILVRFASNFSPQRYSKNFYEIEVILLEVF